MKKKRLVKRSFTLIETALSFSILALILLFLFSTLRSSITLSSKVDHARELILNRYHVHERLSQLFTQLESSVRLPLEYKQLPLYTEVLEQSEILHFIIDNGIDPEEAFTGPLHASLYLDQHCLFLELEPITGKHKLHKRRELLLKNIKTLSWNFYKKPSMLNTHTTSRYLEKMTSWPPTLHDIPYCMTLCLLLDDETSLDYTFALASKIQPIHYDL
jgi:hypothetical protein